MEPVTTEGIARLARLLDPTVNISPDDVTAHLLAQGWVHAGTDATLVHQLLQDPHRNTHLLDLTDTGWALQHPLGERVGGDLFTCPLNARGGDFEEIWDTHGSGKWDVQLTPSNQLRITKI